MKVDFAARKTSRKLARGVCCALALFCLTAPSASALAQSWTAGNGDWSVGGNWTPSIVPNSATSDVIINNNAIVALNMNASVRDLTIGAGDTLNINWSRALTMHGDLTNDGLIFVNPTGTSGVTFLAANEDLSLSGTGSIRLGYEGVWSQITTATGKTVTQQAGHTIEGVGQVGASLINHGVVRADASLGTGSELTLMTNNKTNTNLFEAVENSTLNISGIAVNNTGATIRANGTDAVVQLSGAMSIAGGTLETVGGGLFQTSGSGTKTLNNVTNLGPLNVTNGTTLAAEGTLTNDGLIFVNPTATSNVTLFSASDDLSLTGSGSIRLGYAGVWSQITTATGKTITQQAGHTIEGVGNIAGTLINNGTVRADATLGLGTELHLLTNAKTNNGVFSAVNGGVFRSDSGILTNWDAGTQTLTGGTYEVVGNSTMRLVGVDVQTLNAHVRLDGANSNFFSTAAGSTNALANFDTIGSAGQLSLLSSRQLTSSAGLMSQGIIDLDGALTRLTVTGDFNQTAGLTQLANGATLELLGASNMFGGGMLAGNGTIDGSFTLGNGAVMSPGFSPGQIDVVGDFTWEAGGLIDFDLGLSSDFVDINGDFLKSGAGAWAFNFINNGMSVGTTYDLIGFSGTTTFVASDFSFTNPGAFNGDFAFGNGGQTLQFTLTAIPEPGTGGVLMLTALGLALFRRRRSTK
ncbi:MAG: PEP-CTERM sorting domain-containing protein [Pirellulaceae bacterium]|nr:PEP-CTERM sorting domain-containing protein [Pirellulaceae bacterium]